MIISAHPRSRGENLEALRSGMTLRGSSPLTRGKRMRSLPSARLSRLIPAHAGKTARGRRALRWSWAHPRSRGENMVRVMKCCP